MAAGEMKVHVIEGNCFIEVAPNYLLYICTREELNTLPPDAIMAKINDMFCRMAWQDEVKANQPRGN